MLSRVGPGVDQQHRRLQGPGQLRQAETVQQPLGQGASGLKQHGGTRVQGGELGAHGGQGLGLGIARVGFKQPGSGRSRVQLLQRGQQAPGLESQDRTDELNIVIQQAVGVHRVTGLGLPLNTGGQRLAVMHSDAGGEQLTQKPQDHCRLTAEGLAGADQQG